MKRFISAIMAFAMTATVAASSAVITSSAEEEVIKVACVGDSITDNSKSIYAYPAQLQEMLGDGYDVRNYGYGGTTAMKDGAPLNYWDRTEYIDSHNFQPDIVIFMLGTNDAAGDNQEKALDHFKEDYTALIQTYLDLESQPEVWIATAPWTRDEPRKSGVSDIILPAQLEVAEELGLNVVHTHEATAEFSEYFNDGLHPNTPGYYLLAQVFYEDVFGGTIYDATVIAEEGTSVSVGGYSATADAEGKAIIPVAAGERTFTTNLVGYGTASKTVDVTGDVTVDMTEGFTAVQNLALTATAIDETGGRAYYTADRTPDKLNDGNTSTSWQCTTTVGAGSPISDLWAGYDFGEAKTFDQVVVWWEEATACEIGSGYSISYSDDGKTWTEVTNFNATRANAIDTCTFDAVTARYVRLVCEISNNSKALPQMFELEVYSPKEQVDPGNEPDPEPTGKGDVNGDGEINSTDYTQVRRHFLGTFTIAEENLDAADVDSDGQINGTDFMRIRRHFLGTFVIGE